MPHKNNKNNRKPILQLNYSTQRVNKTNTPKKHYECFSPHELNSPRNKKTKYTVHYHGFTPIVYSTSSDPKHSYCKGGYRSKNNVIGLTNLGYIDIDGIKQSNEEYARVKGLRVATLPTYDLIHKVLTEHNIWHYIHPSASRKAGKYRILYRRGITLYDDSAYTPDTHEWDISHTPVLPHPMAVCDTDIGALDTNPEPEILQGSLMNGIVGLLEAELKQFKEWLSPHMNISGLDSTSAALHMHSKHLTEPPHTPENYPVHTSDSTIPNTKHVTDGCVTMWSAL